MIALALASTVYFVHARAPTFDFSLQSANAPAPRTYDHFDFSGYWLATHGQPDLPIRGQAMYLVDLDARQVLWQRDVPIAMQQ